MPTPLYSEWKPWPADLGYTLRVDHYAGGQRVETMDPVVGGSAQSGNLASLVSKAQTAITNNQTYLAIGSPTNAQVVAQVAALTRQNDAIILYLLHKIIGLTSISGT